MGYIYAGHSTRRAMPGQIRPHRCRPQVSATKEVTMRCFPRVGTLVSICVVLVCVSWTGRPVPVLADDLGRSLRSAFDDAPSGVAGDDSAAAADEPAKPKTDAADEKAKPSKSSAEAKPEKEK